MVFLLILVLVENSPFVNGIGMAQMSFVVLYGKSNQIKLLPFYHSKCVHGVIHTIMLLTCEWWVVHVSNQTKSVQRIPFGVLK